MPHVTRIKIRNYRGIAALDAKVGPGGLIAKGKNAAGKTSLLRALRAALASQDVKEDAIRLGADKAEILIDLDAVSVKRTITPSKSTLEVTADGIKRSKPAQQLDELFGNSPLDPLDLFLAKPDKRREMVLAALPIAITQEQILAWAPNVPHVPAGLTSMHGLEACARLHDHVYELRADANRAVKDIAARLKVAEDEIDALDVAPAPKGTTAETAQKAVDDARVALASLQAQRERAAKSTERLTQARDRIAGWRKQAAETRASAPARPSSAEIVEVCARIDTAARRRKQLEEELADVKRAEEEAQRERAKLEADAQAADDRARTASDLEKMAADLEQSLTDAGELAPDDFALDDAQEALDAATKTLEAVRANAAIAARRGALDDDRKALAAAEERAAALTKIVDRLRVDAPAELIAASQGIPGLGIDGETITLDGKSIDKLSGAEQMRFAVEIARRANARSKILIVDGLERLDPAQYDLFVDEATRDGFQLFATRVDAGEMVIEAIEAHAAEAAE